MGLLCIPAHLRPDHCLPLFSIRHLSSQVSACHDFFPWFRCDLSTPRQFWRVLLMPTLLRLVATLLVLHSRVPHRLRAPQVVSPCPRIQVLVSACCRTELARSARCGHRPLRLFRFPVFCHVGDFVRCEVRYFRLRRQQRIAWRAHEDHCEFLVLCVLSEKCTSDEPLCVRAALRQCCSLP